MNTLNSPFNTCEEISTDDLEFGQAIELYAKVEGKVDVDLIQQIFDIVGGNPYLLQIIFHRLSLIPDVSAEEKLRDTIDFLYSGQDNHFQYLFKMISEDTELKELVSDLVHNLKVPNDPADANCKYLRTVGLAKLEGKDLVFRNKIYKILAANSAVFKGTKVEAATGHSVIANYAFLGDIKEMKNTNVSVSNSSIDGNIITSSIIKDSLNAIEKSRITDEIKLLLTELGKAVHEIINKLPAPEAEEAEDDYKRLVDEAVKKSPNKKWYSVSIDGLQKAAKNLGDVGKPILEITTQLLLLLNQLPK